MRLLIVNADDYGLSPATSRGILAAWQDGIVTSTTVLVNFPWSAECAAWLADAPGLGVGLHLNLTAGSPVLPAAEVPSLVGPEGGFVKNLWHLRHRVRLPEVRREWEAQLRRFVEIVGRPPTHLDSHHHVHCLPNLAAVFVDLARAHGIPAARALRPSDLPAADSLWDRLSTFVFRQYLRASAARLRQGGLRLPDRVLLTDFDRRLLLRWLHELPDGLTELVCHPGYVDDELRRISSRVEARPAELADLTAPEVRDLVREEGICLVHYGQVAG